MNGRVYDPHIGRFLSADPFIQQPDNVQSFNRYSYVLNNPLGYVDASGFFFGKLFKAVFNFDKKIFKGIVNLAKNIFNPQRLLQNILTVAAYIACGLRDRPVRRGSARGLPPPMVGVWAKSCSRR